MLVKVEGSVPTTDETIIHVEIDVVMVGSALTLVGLIRGSRVRHGSRNSLTSQSKHSHVMMTLPAITISVAEMTTDNDNPMACVLIGWSSWSISCLMDFSMQRVPG